VPPLSAQDKTHLSARGCRPVRPGDFITREHTLPVVPLWDRGGEGPWTAPPASARVTRPGSLTSLAAIGSFSARAEHHRGTSLLRDIGEERRSSDAEKPEMRVPA